VDEASKTAILEVLGNQERDAKLLLAQTQDLRELVLSGAGVAELRDRLAEAEEALGVERDPELFQALVRIERFAEPLRGVMVAAVRAVLDVLDAAMITSWEAETRDALAAGE